MLMLPSGRVRTSDQCFSLAESSKGRPNIVMKTWIGRISAKKTIFEPAIASSIALALLFVMLAPRSGSSSLLMFLFMGPIFFGLSCLGGWLGEAWQERAERRRRN